MSGLAEQRRIDRALVQGESGHVAEKPIVVPIGEAGDNDIVILHRPDDEKKNKRHHKVSNRRSVWEPGIAHWVWQAIYFDKVQDYCTAAKITGLPVIGVEIPAHHLAQIALNPECIADDDAWRSLSHSFGAERGYADALRGMLQKWRMGKEPPAFVWVVSLREMKGFILPTK
jgi:hypothetical protein